MIAHVMAFPRFKDIWDKSRTVLHSPHSWYKEGDIIVAKDQASPGKEGVFLRITSVQVGTLKNFMSRPGEAARLNAVPGVSVYTEKKVLQLNGSPWKNHDKWTKIADSSEPV